MGFQGSLILSNIAFLSTFLGMKVWDLLSGRDHVWQWMLANRGWAYGPRALRAGMHRREVQPTDPSHVFRLPWGLLAQAQALSAEGSWLVLSFAPVWFGATTQEAGTQGAVPAHERLQLLYWFFRVYVVVIIVARILEARYFKQRTV